jgi:hypothetical protein
LFGFIYIKVTVIPSRFGLREPDTVIEFSIVIALEEIEHVNALEILDTVNSISELEAPL